MIPTSITKTTGSSASRAVASSAPPFPLPSSCSPAPLTWSSARPNSIDVSLHEDVRAHLPPRPLLPDVASHVMCHNLHRCGVGRIGRPTHSSLDLGDDVDQSSGWCKSWRNREMHKPAEVWEWRCSGPWALADVSLRTRRPSRMVAAPALEPG